MLAHCFGDLSLIFYKTDLPYLYCERLSSIVAQVKKKPNFGLATLRRHASFIFVPEKLDEWLLNRLLGDNKNHGRFTINFESRMDLDFNLRKN